MSAANDDEVVPLTRFRAALARARTVKRADAILADPDADRLIPTLPVQDLYLAIKDVGLADAEELVARASMQQVQGFLDLDAWEGDTLSVERVRPWMDTFATIGFDKLAQVIEAIDPEETALYVQKNATVYDIQEDTVPEEPEGQFYPTPDTFYLLDIKTEGEEGKAFQRFIDHIYRADLMLAKRVMMSARWEIPSDLEEWAYRFRQGRMADLGFPDPVEALTIYKPIDPATLRLDGAQLEAPGEGPAAGVVLPVLIADAIDPRSLLGLAFGTLTTDAEIERVQSALVTLFNRALAADRIEPADLVAARVVLDDVVAYLGLGLEYVQRGEPGVELAGRALRTLPLERIFRAGFSLTASLGRLAETLFVRGRVRLGEPLQLLFDGRHREVVVALRGQGLRGRRPRMARVLDTPPSTGVRPFRTAADVRLAASALSSASRVPVFFFDDLGVSQAAVAEASSASPGLDFGTIARTIAARVLVGGIDLDANELAIAPLRPPEVGALLARLEHGALSSADQATIGQALIARIERRDRTPPVELEAWFASWFADLGRRVADVDGLYVTA